MAEKPRLRQGETPQSASFQKRWREYQKQQALEEATAAQEAQRAEEAARNADRDVLEEAKTQAGPEKPSKPAKKTPDDKKPVKKKTGVRGTASTLRNRGRTIDEAVDAAINDADEDNGVKK